MLPTKLTRTEPMELLQEFYLTAKPIGLWGPVRRSLGSAAEEIQPDTGRELLAAGVGILFYFLLTVSLFSLMGGHSAQGWLTLAAAIPSGLAFGRMAISRLKRTTATSTDLPKANTQQELKPIP